MTQKRRLILAIGLFTSPIWLPFVFEIVSVLVWTGRAFVYPILYPDLALDLVNELPGCVGVFDVLNEPGVVMPSSTWANRTMWTAGRWGFPQAKGTADGTKEKQHERSP